MLYNFYLRKFYEKRIIKNLVRRAPGIPLKATEAADAEQLLAKSNSYVEHQFIHMKKRNIVFINVYRPPDRPTEKFSSPLNELRTKLLEIGNPMPNISYLQET